MLVGEPGEYEFSEFGERALAGVALEHQAMAVVDAGAESLPLIDVGFQSLGKVLGWLPFRLVENVGCATRARAGGRPGSAAGEPYLDCSIHDFAQLQCGFGNHDCHVRERLELGLSLRSDNGCESHQSQQTSPPAGTYFLHKENRHCRSRKN